MGRHQQMVTKMPVIRNRQFSSSSSCAVSPASIAAHMFCFAKERLQARYLDKVSARIAVVFHATEGVEPPSGLLHLQSDGCSPRAQLDGRPLQGSRVPAFLHGASGELWLVIADLNHMVPAPRQRSLSVALALVAQEQKLGQMWPRGYAHRPPLPVRV